MKCPPSAENKAPSVRQLFLLGVVLALLLSALAPSPAAAFIRGCPDVPDPLPPASPLPSPPDGGPPDGGPAPEEPNVCEVDPDCDPESQSCPGVPEPQPKQLQVGTFPSFQGMILPTR